MYTTNAEKASNKEKNAHTRIEEKKILIHAHTKSFPSVQ